MPHIFVSSAAFGAKGQKFCFQIYIFLISRFSDCVGVFLKIYKRPKFLNHHGVSLKNLCINTVKDEQWGTNCSIFWILSFHRLSSQKMISANHRPEYCRDFLCNILTEHWLGILVINSQNIGLVSMQYTHWTLVGYPCNKLTEHWFGIHALYSLNIGWVSMQYTYWTLVGYPCNILTEQSLGIHVTYSLNNRWVSM